MKLSLTIIAVAFLTSCVTIPIPPGGEHQGKLGAIKLSISYVPYHNINIGMDQSTKYALEHFSKTLKDK